VKVGTASSGGMSPGRAVELAKQAEAAGLDSFWVTEGAGGDPFALLSAAALETRHIELGTAVVNIYSRTATVLAQAALTLVELSSGRFSLGLGTSHDEQLAAEHGLERARPLQHMRDVVTVIRELDQESQVTDLALPTLAIQHYALNFTREGNGLPICVAAIGQRMTEWAATSADALITIWQRPDEIAAFRETYPGLRIVSVIHCAVGESAEATHAALRAARERHSRFQSYRRLFARQDVSSGIACTSAKELQSALHTYAEAGLSEAILMPVPGPLTDSYASARILIELAANTACKAVV
jgi:alkanesulfonate monooxygenase SsuD/methylene tetrahydromethanopterin reductase-like flavin-dependent oxidoreductase (luciferase family)